MPEDELYCNLIQPGIEHDDQHESATNRIWSKKTYRLSKVLSSPGNRVMYYLEELAVSETSESRSVVSFLDLLIDISNGDLVCSIFDKRDAFDFDIVNFPDLSGNIPTAPAYGTYNSQLIRYSEACYNYDNFSS